MKKSILAVLALTTLSTAALAQSSVTLFGVLDLNLVNVKNGSAGTTTGLEQGALNTSRIGLRGVEDLGGGLRAGFHLEGQVNPDTGTMTGTFWNRRSTVSLLGTWGELRIGRDYNPSSRNTYLFEPYIGTSVGTILVFTLAPDATLGSNATTALRTNNAIAYFMPRLGGLYGEAMIAPSEGAPGNKYLGARVGYAAGPFDVSGAYGTTDTATGNDFKQWNLGLSVNVGFAKLMGLYNVHEYGAREQETAAVSAAVPFGAVGEFRAMYAINKRTGGAPGTGFANGDDSDLISLGYVHNLSKRTALYAFASSLSNDGGARLTVNGTSPAGMLGGQTSSGYQLGITHRF